MQRWSPLHFKQWSLELVVNQYHQFIQALQGEHTVRTSSTWYKLAATHAKKRNALPRTRLDVFLSRKLPHKLMPKILFFFPPFSSGCENSRKLFHLMTYSSNLNTESSHKSSWCQHPCRTNLQPSFLRILDQKKAISSTATNRRQYQCRTGSSICSLSATAAFQYQRIQWLLTMEIVKEHCSMNLNVILQPSQNPSFKETKE